MNVESHSLQCPFCRVIFNEQKVADAAVLCARGLIKHKNDLQNVVRNYESWLNHTCLQEYLPLIGGTGPLVYQGMFKTAFQPEVLKSVASCS